MGVGRNWRNWNKDEPSRSQPGIDTLRTMRWSCLGIATLGERRSGCVAATAIALLAGLCLTNSSAMADASVVATTAGPSLAIPELATATPSGYLRGIGSDGGEGVWFSEDTSAQNVAYMAHYSPSQADLTRITIKPVSEYDEYIQGIAPGLNGAEWFASFYDNQVSHITASGKLKITTLPPSSEPEVVAVDQHGDVWFTERGGGCHLGRLSPTGKLTKYGVGGECFDLTIGPDGNIWIAVYTANVVDELSATTGELLASYSMHLPDGIATSGNTVWVTEDDPDDAEPSQIAAISATGQITDYELPGNRVLGKITAAPDGAVWFTEGIGPVSGFGGIGRLTPKGALSEAAIPDDNGAAGIAATSNAIYFTQDGSEPGLMRIPLSNLAEPDEASYVALGDSYSSGEGDPPFEENAGSFDTCHRSQLAYGPLLDGTLGLGPMIFKACSGGVTDDFFHPNPGTEPEPPQLSWLRQNDKTVTLTVGGDDAGFVHILEECIAGPRGSFPFLHLFGCSKDEALQEETQTRLSALAGKATAFTPSGRPIHSVLNVIRAVHAEALNAHIVVGGYPQLFGSSKRTYELGVSPSGRVCLVGTANIPVLGEVPLSVDYFDAQWMNKLAKELDAVIHQAVEEAAHNEGTDVSYAEPQEPKDFKGHGLCDVSEPWLHALELNSSNEQEPGSFHPTPNGQRLGYEPAFARQLK
jgi:streptogramin lyase